MREINTTDLAMLKKNAAFKKNFAHTYVANNLRIILMYSNLHSPADKVTAKSLHDTDNINSSIECLKQVRINLLFAY